jgi:hypothetical protein
MTNGGRTEPEMHVIPTDECYRLLSTHEFGRMGVIAEHYPSRSGWSVLVRATAEEVGEERRAGELPALDPRAYL